MAPGKKTFSGQAVLTADFLRTVAHHPGVYLMKDAEGMILYVGKARDLRKRLSSYARYSPDQHTKTAVMLAKVAGVETILTNTEKEALILEASLIKEHRPRYNVILRDDKSYPLIKVTVNETWPRLIMTRRRSRDGARYFGPFSSSSAMWETIKYLTGLFPLRRCKGRELVQRDRPCLNYQLGRCLAPCAGKVDQQKYQEQVRNILLILEGRNRQVLRELEGQMAAASDDLRFEEAALYRDRIRALRKTFEKQLMVSSHRLDQDIFSLVRQGGAVVIAVVFVRHGVVNGSRTFFLADPIGDDAEILSEALKRYYGDEEFLPHEVLLPLPVEDMDVLADWLTERRGGKVQLFVPQRGDKRKLLQMAAANAAQVFADRDKKARSWQGLASALQHSLRLVRTPERIECLDISNIGGELAVGALVCFVQGEKQKTRYRHYKIRTASGPDDYGMMAEVLERRLARGRKEGDLPDLLLVDGGKGQLNVARAVVADLGIADRVDLAGIAKERDGEGEKLYRPARKNPIILPRHAPVLLFLMRVRDEAHRYGITFHRKWRRKKMLSSKLDHLPGIGAVRRKALLKSLGSMQHIEQASVDELAAVPGIGRQLAEQVWHHLHD